ncbi:MAG: signal peptide peptidase SppA [Myxococcales bacterium]|nr:signal peptide peptidase SppA [Myxococcales bacterium]
MGLRARPSYAKRGPLMTAAQRPDKRSSGGPSQGILRAPRRGLGCLVTAMVGLAFLGAIGFMLAAAGGGPGLSARLREVPHRQVEGAAGRIAWLELHGPMVAGDMGFAGGAGITQDTLAMLERAVDDPTIKGILLHLDTPGGSVTDADRIHSAITKARAKSKTVFVLMDDLCASGGVYAAVAAQEIWALPTTVTGSIGVIIAALNASKLLEKIGIEDTSITSGPNKAMLSPTRPVDPEHTRILQGVVDAMYERFVTLVAQGRNLPTEKVRALADGRILTAEQAVSGGLVDHIGDADAALDALQTDIGQGSLDIVRYEVEPSLADLLRATLGRPDPQAALFAQIFGAPRAMYLFSTFGSAR